MHKSAATSLRFRDELSDFMRFVRRPDVTPRLPGRAAINGWWEDWFPSLSVGRLVQWALLLWTINLILLGPLAVIAAGAGGAVHRLNLDNIPWMQALLWAPVVEELVFRYGLRHIGMALWVVPASVCALLFGPQWFTLLLVAATLVLCWWPPGLVRQSLPWRWRTAYVRWFPWVIHASCLAFAAVHLNNFSFHATPYWLMPVLVLPQWLTGLVLAWLRVRRGIGASMLLHGIFNGGPLLIVWIILQTTGSLSA